jgi:hypothetical protein
MRGDGISPRDASDAFHDDAVDTSDGKSSDNANENYSPTPAYKKLSCTMCTTKHRNSKVILDSSYYTFLCLLTFDTKQFAREHPQVYSNEEMQRFDSDFQKQLAFNFCAMCATRKKAVAMNKTRGSCLHDADLDITPASFTLKTTDCTKLYHYVLENVLGCPVGCRLIVCIRADLDANANGTKVSYSNQAKFISASRKECSIKTKSWRMSGKQYIIMQGCIIQATLHNEFISKMLLRSRFKCYYENRSGDIGVVFDGSSAILSVPWHDIINYSHIIMFFEK